MTKENESTAYSCKYVNNQESTELLGYDCIKVNIFIIHENAKGQRLSLFTIIFNIFYYFYYLANNLNLRTFFVQHSTVKGYFNDASQYQNFVNMDISASGNLHLYMVMSFYKIYDFLN